MRKQFTLPHPWWSPDGVNKNRIHRDDALTLQKRMGARIWDALVYDRDSITNPVLTILANDAGNEAIKILSLYKNRKEMEANANVPRADELIKAHERYIDDMNKEPYNANYIVTACNEREQLVAELESVRAVAAHETARLTKERDALQLELISITLERGQFRKERDELLAALTDIRDCAFDPFKVAGVESAQGNFALGTFASRVYSVANAAIASAEGSASK